MADFAPNPFALLVVEDGDDLSKVIIIHPVTPEKAVSDYGNQTGFSQDETAADNKNKGITILDTSKQIQNKFKKKQKQKLKNEKLDDQLYNYEKISNINPKAKGVAQEKKHGHGSRRKHNLWTKHQNYWRLILVLSVLIAMDSLFTLTFNYFSSM